MLKFALISALAVVASAQNICTYTGYDCDTYYYGCCLDIAQDTCCTWPSNYGWSVDYNDMPMTSTWMGYAYGDTCETETSGIGSSSGSACASVYDAPGYINWKSGSWVSDYLRRRSLEDTESKRDTECVSINAIGFVDANGEKHRVQVPEGKLDEVNGYVLAGNVEELLKLQTV